MSAERQPIDNGVMNQRGYVKLEQFERRKQGWMPYALVAIPLLVTMVVFWHGTKPAGPSTPSINDKVAHFIVFGGLAVSCAPFVAHVSAARPLSRLARVVWCATYATLIGGALEVWQAALPYRSAEWLDFIADIGGAFIASGLVWAIIAQAKRQATNA